ncbi:MAG: amino acid ABC transporter permease [Nocardioidaceae bacterium]|nr:amino acid ABC transporter permease [Nocardioidaceae bacterium]
MDAVRDNWRDVLYAFGLTVEISVLAGVIALVLGFLLGALRVSPVPVGRAVAAVYVRLVRNTPLLLIMLITTFTLPVLGLRPDINLNDWFGIDSHNRMLNLNFFVLCATGALGLYTAAFVCEAVRSGINSIPIGQAEAARSIGMTFGQTLRLVVLPQAYRAVIPPLTSTMIAMTKNSSVAVGVGVTDATFQMRKLNNDNGDQILQIFVTFAIGYMILVFLISAVGSLLERRAAA